MKTIHKFEKKQNNKKQQQILIFPIVGKVSSETRTEIRT